MCNSVELQFMEKRAQWLPFPEKRAGINGQHTYTYLGISSSMLLLLKRATKQYSHDDACESVS